MNNDQKNILGRISDFFIERYRVAYLIIAAIVLLGVQSYLNLPREEIPEIILPNGIVTVNYTGAAPQDIESLITDKIEAQLNDIDGLQSLTSTSSNGIVNIIAEFDYECDISDKVNEMTNKVSEIEGELPEGCSTVIKGFDSSDKPIMTLNISGDYDFITLKKVSEDIQSEIEKIDGVNEVTMVGGLEREIIIHVDISKLATYNISINQIKNAIVNSNINFPGGNIDLDDMHYTVRTVAQFNEIKEIENTIILVQNDTPIYLKDIASVEDTYEDVRSYSEIYQKGLSAENSVTPAITLSITRDKNSDTIGISNEIKETIIKDGKGTIYPEDVFVSVTGDVAIEVDKALTDVVGNAMSGLLIVIIVLFLFIGFKESLIVAFVIPLSLLCSITLLDYNGMSLNTMSLVALILALGMLVDNAIVIMENIDRIRDEGLDIVSASKIATNQVAPAVFAATLTTMSAFLPMAMISGMIGLFLKVIPVTVVFAIGASFVISLVITPALCSLFLSKYKGKNNGDNSKRAMIKKITSIALVFILSLIAFMDNGKFGLLSWIFAIVFSIAMFYKQFKNRNSAHGESKIIKIYANWMDKILRSKAKKITLIIVSIVIFCTSLLTIPLGLLQIELFPVTDNLSFTIDVETPSGYLVEDTGDIVREIETILFSYPEVEAFVSKVGSHGTRFTTAGDNPKYANISVDLVPENERDRSSMEIIDSLRNDLKRVAGAEITLEQAATGPESGKPINIKLIGEDLEQMKLVSNDFAEILKEIPGTTEVSTTLGDNPPEIQIIIDKEKASLLGLDVRNISSEIRNEIHGVEVSTFIENNDETDIIIKTNDEEITSINDFEKIYFTSSKGEKIAFSQVASLVETKGLNEIEHEDLKKIVKVQSNLGQDGNSTKIVGEFQSRISDYPLPNGIEVSYGGENEDIQESFAGMFMSMILAILLVFIILAVQFNSLSQPMVVLFSVPLATIGAIVGLIITGNNFGLYSFMGIVSLVGIAVNDAIVLVDYTNYLRRNGSSLIEAIIEAGKTRFMPVLATSITTIGGILPLALKEPDYAQMGYALIFGLVASTLLTLVYIPMLYSIIEGFKDKIRKRVPIFSDRG